MINNIITTFGVIVFVLVSLIPFIRIIANHFIVECPYCETQFEKKHIKKGIKLRAKKCPECERDFYT